MARRSQFSRVSRRPRAVSASAARPTSRRPRACLPTRDSHMRMCCQDDAAAVNRDLLVVAGGDAAPVLAGVEASFDDVGVAVVQDVVANGSAAAWALALAVAGLIGHAAGSASASRTRRAVVAVRYDCWGTFSASVTTCQIPVQSGHRHRNTPCPPGGVQSVRVGVVHHEHRWLAVPECVGDQFADDQDVAVDHAASATRAASRGRLDRPVSGPGCSCRGGSAASLLERSQGRGPDPLVRRVPAGQSTPAVAPGEPTMCNSADALSRLGPRAGRCRPQGGRRSRRAPCRPLPGRRRCPRAARGRRRRGPLRCRGGPGAAR